MFELQKIMKDVLLYGNRSPRTIKTYGTYTTEFLEHCILHGIEPLEIAPEQIRNFLDGIQLARGLSNATINNATSQIKFLLLVNGYQYWDPIIIPFKKVHRGTPYVPTEDTVEFLINSIDDDHIKEKTMVAIMYSSGMRVSECCNLKCEDILRSRKQIHIRYGKGDKERWVILEDQTYELIVKYWTGLPARMRSRDWLFTQQTNVKKPCDKEFIERYLRLHCKELGLPNIAPHVLRRAYATHSILNNIDIHELKALMGHSSIDTTMLYVHYADVLRSCDTLSPMSKMRIRI